MSGSYDVFGKAETEVTRAALIQGMVQRALIEESQMISMVKDVSNLAQPGAASVLFPKRSLGFKVEKLDEESEADVQTFNYGGDVLSFDQHAVIAWFVKKKTDLQATINLEADLIDAAATEHAIDIDRYLMKLLVAGAAATKTITGGVWTKAAITDLRAKIKAASKMRRGEFFMAVTSENEGKLLAIDDFVHADTYGSTTPLQQGELGRLYGVRVVTTDEDVFKKAGVTYDAVMWERNALVFGAQASPELNSLYIPKKVGTEHALDQLYGAKVMDGGVYAGLLKINA